MLVQCLQLLNRRVQDPVASLSDHTVVSIACLAALEHDKDNMKGQSAPHPTLLRRRAYCWEAKLKCLPAALAMHISGLKQVVRLRGGLEAIRASNPMVANLTFWLSMISINEPALLPLSYGSDPIPFYHAREAQPLHTHSGALVDLRTFGVDVPTANILHEVQRLSQMYTAAVDYGTPAEATQVLSHLCSIVDRLMRMSRESEAAETDSPVPGLSRSCRLAGCLHIFNPMTVSHRSALRSCRASDPDCELTEWRLVGLLPRPDPPPAHPHPRPQDLPHAHPLIPRHFLSLIHILTLPTKRIV